MLPDSWKELNIYQKEADIYKNAYIDFFANEGSDDGDMFARVINNLPWAMVYEKVSTLWKPAQDAMQGLTKSQQRTTVENLAFYLTGPEGCSTCSINMQSPKLEKFIPSFVSTNPLDSYILEDTQSADAKKKGQLLIAYESHSDLSGKASNEDSGGEPIDLSAAKKDAKTCKEAVENSVWGLNWVPGMEGKNLGPAVAGVIGGTEMLTYYFLFWGGIFSTVWSQTETIPQFRDCVDADEGYFIHYFAPAIKEQKKSEKAVPELSTEKAADFLSYAKDQFMGSVSGDKNSMTQEAASDIGKEIDKFVKNAKKSNIVQAKLSLSGSSSGKLEGTDLLYIWVGEGAVGTPSSYNTTGKTVISDPEKGISITADNATGQLLRNGVPIITNPDAVRLMSTDTRIPANEIPQNLTISCMPDTNETAFVINSRGESFVESPALLNCLKEGVMMQTGLPMNNKNLTEVFGRVNSVATASHPNIRPNDTGIVAEGSPRKIAEGEAAAMFISTGGNVNLSSSNDGLPSLGKLVSIQFKNGVIVVKPDGCLLVWLKHHENGILNQNDAKGLKTTLTHDTNPETGCEEPAVNFEVQGNPESGNSEEKAKLFNQSLAKMGPFQSFETPDKRYILYMDESCVEHLRIIDKATGQITDYTGTTTQTPTGIKFTDENGKVHTLDFASKDGVPTVTYDGGKPEVLTAAQGRNGSFWYDPKEGLWYAENGQLLPLLDAFRKGISTQAGPNGVTSTAAGNVLNLELGNDKSNLLNLPSLPGNILVLFIFIAAMASSFAIARRVRLVSVKRRKPGGKQ